jgi:hypothetical protein
VPIRLGFDDLELTWYSSLLLQLIKQLGGTPTIPAQGASAETQLNLDPRIALRANREVFFFRLVCCCLGLRGYDLLTESQEREIEKVNVLYIQKEAEVSATISPTLFPTLQTELMLIFLFWKVFLTLEDLARKEAYDPGSQRLSFENLSQLCNPR